MKLLVIAPEQNPVPPLVGSSVETCIHHIARAMSGENDITIMSRRHPRYAPNTRNGNIRHIRVARGTSKSYLQHVIAAIPDTSFDVVQVDNRPYFLPAVRRRFPNTPLTLFLHSLTFVTPPKTSLARAGRQMEHADLIVANSRSLEKALVSRFPHLKHKIKHVYLGVDPGQFRLPSSAERLRARKRYDARGRFTVVFAGRVVPLKGIPVLLKAAKIARRSIPTLQVVIAGSTFRKAYLRKLKAMAKHMQVPVKWPGYVPRKQMPLVYWTADAFVLPSQKHEAFGLVVVEAMGAGAPVIASRIGGIPEIVTHAENGLLVEPYHRPAAFAKAFIRLKQDQDLKNKLIQEGRNTVLSRFTWRSTAAQVEQLYRSLQGDEQH